MRIKNKTESDHFWEGAWKTRTCKYGQCTQYLCRHNHVQVADYYMYCSCGWGRYPRWVRHKGMRFKTHPAVKENAMRRKQGRKRSRKQ